MRFKDIIGNDKVREALVNMADTGRVAHAMLFYENEGCGALPLAIAYLQYLNCPDRHDGDSCGVCPTCNKISKLIHPDVHCVFPTNSGSKCSLATKDITSDNYIGYWRELTAVNPYFLESDLSEAIGIEGKTGAIAVQEARQLISKLSLTPVENGYKAVIFWLPEKMNAAAANKLLKIVEEPPEKTIFLFITHNPDKVMQTIFSRCQSSRILPLTKDEVALALIRNCGIDEDTAWSQANASSGSVGVALRDIRSSEDRQSYLDIFSSMMDAVAARDLPAALEAGEAVAALPSREKQKAFCNFATECIRNIFLTVKGMSGLVCATAAEQAFIDRASGQFTAGYCTRAFPVIDKAVPLLERNVSQKILFCDLVDRLFMMYKK